MHQINNNNSVVDSSKAKLIENQYIVVFNEIWDDIRSESTAEIVRIFTNQFVNDIGLPPDSIRSRYEYAIRGFSAKIHDPVLSRIQDDPRVKEIIQDVRAPVINHSFKKMTYESKELILSGQTTPWGISRVGGPLDGIGLSAWILDTGIDLTHDDLNVNLNRSASFIATENADDFNGHGTHVAGTIAAIDNSIDVVGVAAGATVVSVKVVDQNGQGTLAEGIDGVEYVASNAHNDDIVNMSLCYHENFFPDRHLIDNAVENVANTGIRFSIAAGNNSEHSDNCSPARVNHQNTWTVSAHDNTDTFAPFSNFGNPPISYSNPGVDILSLWMNGGTNTISGTSMAAPHIAGILLATGDEPLTDGTVSNDPDMDPDPIAAATITLSAPFIFASVNNDHPQLSWSAVDDAEEYKIYRRIEQGSWQWIASVSTTSFTDWSQSSPNMSVIFSPPPDWDNTLGYRVKSISSQTGYLDSPYSNSVYFSTDGSCNPCQ